MVTADPVSMADRPPGLPGQKPGSAGWAFLWFPRYHVGLWRMLPGMPATNVEERH